MTHTRGPWKAKDRMVLALAFDGSEKAIVDRVRGGSPEEADANTRLIAAAPDLLTALKHVAETTRIADWPNEPALWALYQSSPEMQEIHAAIAKATGR